MNEKYIHFNRSVDVYRSSPWCCCVGAGPGSSDLLQDKTQKSRVCFRYDRNRPTSMFPPQRTNGNNHLQAIYYSTVSILGLVVSFFAEKSQSTNECPGDPRKNSLLPASLTNPHPDSAIYSNVSGFPKPQDQPDESVSVPSSPEQPGVFYSTVNYNNDSKGVALKTGTDSVMYSTIQKTQ